ncbi:FXSXX-COOH protein [Streptomyces sp. So13.3]|uniref:FxSxx-COOH cyclophane-containing RiPP peptide n=1 Tax=Streptomyces TaxID=1883 RepID=UPI001105FEED|nr:MULTISPECIES: FxSxx-COOH cyclophane-containing RiPP peptide [Streptomyces]MCZ4095918.1 FxSxx-COOH protein [Streptomyces sp. H39-C1]QNA75250.1 FXSXX-COOH protein [Streptomyces sp. So13.3]
MGQENSAERTGTAADPDGLPDLLDLDLETLRELDHPVLSEVLEGLRTRLGEPSETLWAFNSAF